VRHGTSDIHNQIHQVEDEVIYIEALHFVRIEKRYNGEIFLAEKINPLLQDYKSKWHISSELKEKFEEKLTEQLKSDFETIMLGELELNALGMTQAFVDGYKFGVKFLIETLTEEKKDAPN